jgi:hypothetical protein
MGMHRAVTAGWLRGVAVSAWLLLGFYVALDLWLGAGYQPKVYIEQHGLAAYERFEHSALGRLREHLTPVWAQNPVIVPLLGGLAVLSTAVAWRTRRRAGAV